MFVGLSGVVEMTGYYKTNEIEREQFWSNI